MGRYKSIFGIAAAVILILGVLAYTQLEIYPRPEPLSPSRSVRANSFYALEKWLTKTGHPVRVDSRGNPSRLLLAKERSVFIQASLFDWQDGTSILIPWVEEGGSLLISLESGWYDEDDENFAQFLETIGVQAELWVPGDDEEDESTVILQDTENAADDASQDSPPENFPFFDTLFRFSLPEDFDSLRGVHTPPLGALKKGMYPESNHLTRTTYPAACGGVVDFDDTPVVLNDWQGITRLVSVPLGQGSITVTGRPYFMYNDNLESEENARLSWELTAAKADGENGGVLFIRGRRAVKSLFGKLAERGNLLPPIVSVLALVCIGFWMVIPGFGVLRSGDERRLRPIGDRFRSEARFLKKYHALEVYLEVCLREIKNKCRDRETDPRVSEIEHSLDEKKNLAYGEIIRELKILETIMEHL